MGMALVLVLVELERAAVWSPPRASCVAVLPLTCFVPSAHDALERGSLTLDRPDQAPRGGGSPLPSTRLPVYEGRCPLRDFSCPASQTPLRIAIRSVKKKKKKKVSNKNKILFPR